MAPEQDWMIVARLLRPQGRRGEILAEPEGEAEIFTPGRSLWLGATDASNPETATEQHLESAWQPTGRNAGRIVVKLRGIDSISAAEALSNCCLMMPVAELPPLADDTFHVRDLLGCALFDGDRLAGTVVDIQFPVAGDGRTRLTDAPDLLAVAPASADPDSPDAEPYLVPFARAWLVEIDLPGRRIVMNLPPGLVEPEAE